MIKKHNTYEKDNMNLKMVKEISLIEALTGFSFNLKKLDDRFVTIKSKKGEIINDG